MTDDFGRMPASDETNVSDTTPETTTGAAAVGAGAPARRGSSRRGAIVVIAIVVVGILAVGGVRANAVWGRHAMMAKGATAIQALVEGKAQELAAVSNASVRAGLTGSTAQAMQASGILGDFTAPAWSGDEATITVTTGTGVGEIVLAPAPDGSNVVVFRTGGAIGMSVGALSAQRTWAGWVVSGLTVAPVQKPAGHPTTTATGTPAP